MFKKITVCLMLLNCLACKAMDAHFEKLHQVQQFGLDHLLTNENELMKLRAEIEQYKEVIQKKESEIELHLSIGRHLVSKVQNSITNLKKSVEQE